MRSFLIICLASIAIAAPQYTYPQGGGGGVPGFTSQTGFTFETGRSFAPTFQSSPGFFSAQRSQQQSHRAQQQALPPIVTKNIFIHAAPEETDEEVQEDIQQLRQSRKHYNVVFIKAQSQAPKRTALALAQALNEEKTVIYVLSKKPDASEVRAVLQQQNYEPKKPEVFFIKYKTPEEAQYAQQQIQAQYDALGGATQISDEGIAPITSVIGSLGGGGGSTGVSGGISGGDIGFQTSSTIGQSTNIVGEVAGLPGTYLPAKHK